MTELTDCERTQDVWLKSVQDEFRIGKLSIDTHAFLHGEPTLVPGKTVNGKATCKNRWCQQRARATKDKDSLQPLERAALAAETLISECDECKQERKERKLVATSASDWRFTTPKFEMAPSVFPNNDVNYKVNKDRAHTYATRRGIGIMYCAAKDTPTADALRDRPDLPSQKVSWSNRHDRESGDLYGMLPLMKGMPVAMTDHVDRSQDKLILRGRVGTVVSWTLADDETSVFQNGKKILKKLPKVVYVQFKEDDGRVCKWQLPGLKPGVYPIVPVKRDWYLDKGKKSCTANS